MQDYGFSNKIKQRFCKDCGIAIHLFDEPYFTDRMKLYDKFFNCISKWQVFVAEYALYGYDEQAYFTHYNRIKDLAINAIKESEGYKKFNAENMQSFAAKNQGFPSHDIFKSHNVGKWFVSIDMVKANFTALSHYDSSIFGGKETWEEFLGEFTENEHIINSKYIRQVIMGNCNPKRQVTYEKFLMDNILSYLFMVGIPKEKIVFFSNDEIIVDVTLPGGWFDNDTYELLKKVQEVCTVKTRVTAFKLYKIAGTRGYLESLKDSDDLIDFKCLDGFAYPFVLRAMLHQEPTESDLVFEHEGHLAKYITYPKIEITDTWKDDKPEEDILEEKGEE